MGNNTFVKRSPPVGSEHGQPSNSQDFTPPVQTFPCLNPKDYLQFVRKAVISSANDATAPLFDSESPLSVSGIKWLQRADASLTKDPLIIKTNKKRYEDKLTAMNDEDDILRNKEKLRLWSLMGSSKINHEAASLLDTARDRYFWDMDFLDKKLNWEIQSHATEEQKATTFLQLGDLQDIIKLWDDVNASATDLLAMAKKELINFAHADAPDAKEDSDPADHATKAIAWIIKAHDAQNRDVQDEDQDLFYDEED